MLLAYDDANSLNNGGISKISFSSASYFIQFKEEQGTIDIRQKYYITNNDLFRAKENRISEVF